MDDLSVVLIRHLVIIQPEVMANFMNDRISNFMHHFLGATA
jgi:hypothetical protein